MLEHLSSGAHGFIAHARIKGCEATRPAFERLSSRLELRARSLPPAAILVVRSLGCRTRSRQLSAEDVRQTLALERDVQQALDTAARQAARPRRGDAADGASAVRFDDLAELIECLARDWLSGEVAVRWWWRAALRGVRADLALHELCRRHPELLPAIFERLATTGHAVPLAASLGAEEARILALAIGRAFHVPHDLPRLMRGGPPRTAGAGSARGGGARLAAALPELRVRALERPSMVLLALALGLARAPALVRGHGFAHFAASLPEAGRERGSPRKPRVTPIAEGTCSVREPATGSDATAACEPLPPIAASDAPGSGARPRQTNDGNPRSAAGARKTHGAAPLQQVPFEAARADLAVTADAVERAGAPVAVARDDARHGVAIESRLLECRTAFGGLFYVLNAALHLGLYGDFTQPRFRGIALSPWDFLAVCGRSWFGSRFAADPVWRVLATLSARKLLDDEGPPRVRAFRGPRLPRRLHWLGRYPGLEPRMYRRLARLLPLLEARIAAALGERGWRRAIESLVCAEARVNASDTRVDVHLHLEQLPLHVRHAGLDRDPGWIPAAGRHVAFHFD